MAYPALAKMRDFPSPLTLLSGFEVMKLMEFGL